VSAAAQSGRRRVPRIGRGYNLGRFEKRGVIPYEFTPVLKGLFVLGYAADLIGTKLLAIGIVNDLLWGRANNDGAPEWTDPVDVNGMAEAANVCKRDMQDTLTELVELGLLERRPAGVTFRYRVNWPAVKALRQRAPRRIKQPARTARVDGPQLMAAKTGIKEPEPEPELETVEAVVQCPGCGLVYPVELVEIDGVLTSEGLAPIAAARGGPTTDYHPPGKEAVSENSPVQFHQLNLVEVNSSSPQENADVPPPERRHVGRSWEAVKRRLADKLSPEAFDNWLAGTREVGHTNVMLAVHVPNLATKQWLTEEYDDLVRDAMLAEGLAVRVEYVIPATFVCRPGPEEDDGEPELKLPSSDDSKAAMVKWLESVVPADTVGRGLSTWQAEELWKLKRKIGREKFCNAVLAKVRSGYQIRSWGLVIQVVQDAAKIAAERRH